MSLCPNCRVPTVRQPTGLFKCSICGFLFKPGQATPLLNKYLPQNGSVMKSQGDQDLEVFIERLTRKLLPIYKDYPENVKKVSYANRDKIKTAFLKVADGKLSFKKWFEYIHTSLGKHPVDLAELLLGCTEGLNSPEIKEFRKGCDNYYQYIADMYNVSKIPGAKPK
jgi:hypothetical protein